MNSSEGCRRPVAGRYLRVATAAILAFSAVLLPISDADAAKKKSRPSAPSIAAAIVIDMNAGKVLHSKEADSPRHPASLTKIMTLYMLFGYLRAGSMTLESDLVVTPHAASQAPTKLGLKAGSTIKVKDAIYALVTKSANDAAATIAENLGGTETNFARAMTQKARSLGMSNTVFRNASGLPDPAQITTARDMAILAQHVIRDYPEYYGVFETRYYTYKGQRLRNHNKLLFGYKGTDGIKTGYTRASGFNLTASVRRDNKHLVAVVLGGRTGAQRDAAMRALLDQQFPKAQVGTQNSRALVASLKSAPPPPPKKPTFAMASMAGPAAAPARGRAPVVAEGDISEKPIPASLTSSRANAGGTKFRGTYHVQVGAFLSQADAENRLGMVQQRAPKLLAGYQPFTASFDKGGQEWYRARFAGFSQSDAQSACSQLKKLSLDCIAMRAE